ncbi:hypothetical protein [Pseudoalteromonas sp. MMG005]|nr:hypothetical protein [Pseudoalteromonas sp. MMG005]
MINSEIDAIFINCAVEIYYTRITPSELEETKLVESSMVIVRFMPC